MRRYAFNTLTKYPSGSLRELWSISWPLIIGLFAVLAGFVDRLLIAKYSVNAFIAFIPVSSLCWAILFGCQALIKIAAVFVAQLHGAGDNKKLAMPTWQMIWLSLGSIFFFLPLSFFGAEYIFKHGQYASMQRDFFSLFMLFAPIHLLVSALNSFFLGQGKTRLISLLSLCSGVLGAFLDIPFIFGIEGLIPPFGMSGAALAIGCSETILVIALAFLFIRSSREHLYDSCNWKLHWPLLRDCIRIGLPVALLTASERFGWTTYLFLMSEASHIHIMVASIFNSLMMLLKIFPEGVHKGVCTLASFQIGSKQTMFTKCTIKAGLCLITIYCFLIALVAILLPTYLTAPFISEKAQKLGDALTQPLTFAMTLLPLYLLIQGWSAIVTGALKAAKDTWFKMFWGSSSIWLFLIVPTYIILQTDTSVAQAILPIIGYAIFTGVGYLFRYQHIYKTIRQKRTRTQRT